ncbi:hypothetical protein DESC_880089 [Desulfosarcina cetonica]|nr:hypothetical protein DESC_880089 [Desulfosarcina cetonica]
MLRGLSEFVEQGIDHVAVKHGMCIGEVEKRLARQDDQDTGGFGDHGGTPGVAVQQAHLTKVVIWLETIDHELPSRFVAAQRMGLALEQHIQAIGLVPGSDHQGVFGNFAFLAKGLQPGDGVGLQIRKQGDFFQHTGNPSNDSEYQAICLFHRATTIKKCYEKKNRKATGKWTGR